MKRFIRELKEKDHVQSYFLVSEKNSGTDRNGKFFLNLALSDSTGKVNGRMFEKANVAAESFQVGDVLWIKGFVQLYQGRKQLIVNDLRKATANEYSMTEMIADMAGNVEDKWTSLRRAVDEIHDQFIRTLLVDTLEDPECKSLLMKSPAAKTIHHAYRGGLLEHIESIVGVMYKLADHYSFLNRDLLVFGAIYHDIGKIYELELNDGIHYTRRGQLVGHMAIACEMIDTRAKEVAGFPKDLIDVLKHIVLSHHGKLEYGSPKIPMLAEALVVSMIDELDSRMNMLFHFLKSEVEQSSPEEKWSHYHGGFERYFLLEYFRKSLKES